MKIQKKHIIAGAIGLLTISGALAYLQYKKVIDYLITFKSVKIKKITAKEVDFDIFLNYTNKAKVGFNINTQKYDVYINDIFITSLINNAPTYIAPSSVSVIGLNIAFNPEDAFKKINKTFASVLSNPEKIIIKIDSKLKVKIGVFAVNIPYVYQDTLKNMMA